MVSPAQSSAKDVSRQIRSRSELQESVLGILADVLKVTAVGPDDNFFELGGDSVHAMRLVGRIRRTFGADVNVGELFRAPTGRDLTELVGERGSDQQPGLTPTRRTTAALSYAQQRLWFLAQLEGPGGTYTVPFVLRFVVPVEFSVVEAAVGDLVRRHQVLRTIYPDRSGVPYQQVLEGDDARPVLHQVSCQENQLSEVLSSAAARGTDITTELPLAAWLIDVRPTAEHPPVRTPFVTQQVLLITVHHIASDGRSRQPLLRDLGSALDARSRGTEPQWPALEVQYIDYSVWQRHVLGDEQDPGSVLARQSAYWRARLDELPEQLALPTDRPRPPVASYRGGVAELFVEADTHSSLAALARTHRCTLFMVLQAAVAVVLSAVGAGDDVPIGTPVAGRDDPTLEDSIGFFSNTLVLRNDLSGNPSFTDLLHRVRESAFDAYGHQDLPFELLVELLNPARSLSRHPLFQVMVALADDRSQPEPTTALAVEVDPQLLDIAKFDLSVDFAEQRDRAGEPSGLRVLIEYATDLFDRASAVTLGERLIRMLRTVAADPAVPIKQLDVLSPEERQRLIADGLGPVVPEVALDVVDQVRCRARETPEAVAVSAAGRELTYLGLATAADDVARRLAADGAGPDTVVAVLGERSPWFVTMCLGVLAAGAAYLPIDPSTPAVRTARMLQDAGVEHLLAQDGLSELSREIITLTGRPVGLPNTETPVGPAAELPAQPTLDPASLAYVVFTSGSTGRPKGVLVPRRGLANHLAAVIDVYGLNELDTMALNAPLSFDVVIWQTLTTLCTGGRVHIIDPDTGRDPLELLRCAAANGITVLQIVPTLLRELLDRWDEDDSSAQLLTGLHWMLVHGEALPPDLARRWFDRFPGSQLANVYGPAECSDDVSIFILDSAGPTPAASVPVGRPLRNTRTYVLDRDLRLAPPGMVGELYVAGAGLARGYAGRPDLTAERFLADPFGAPGERMYRTGDLARWDADGELHFAGRVDHQIKIRGSRVEPEEVEAVIERDPAVRQAVVVVREDRPGDRRLVAYVTADPTEGVDGTSLRTRLRANLPQHMVPSAVVVLDQLPATVNGKLDRAALPVPDYLAGSSGSEPVTVPEEVLCELFDEVLGTSGTGTQDSFFELGGHSMLAMRLVSRIRTVFGVTVEVRELFRAPTVGALASVIQEIDGQQADDRDLGSPVCADEERPFP